MIKNILIFLAGVATGVGGTYIFMKSKNEKDFEERVNEEVKSQVGDIRNAFFDSKEEDTDLIEDEEMYTNLSVNVPKMEEEDEENTDNYFDYSKAFKTASKTVEKGPIMVNEELFNSLELIDKVTLDYWDEDGVLANEETDEMVEDGISVIGEENVEKATSKGLDEFYIYVPNKSIGYYVVVQHGSYHHAVLGMYDESELDEDEEVDDDE